MDLFKADRIKGARAARAVEAMKVYEDKYPGVDAEDVVTTLLSDLMLYCDVFNDDFEWRVKEAKREYRLAGL
jgi:hypothetical protein